MTNVLRSELAVMYPIVVVLGPGKLILEPQEGGFATPEVIVGGACFEAEVLEMLTKGQPGRVSEAIQADGDWILVLARVGGQ